MRFKVLIRYRIFIIPLLIFWGCGNKSERVHILRFEQELFDSVSMLKQDHYRKLQNKYADFYTAFAEKMLNISNEESGEAYAPSLSKFVAFPTIKMLKLEVDSVFPDLEPYEKELGKATSRFKKEFPDRKVPTFVSFISEFGYGNITLDTMVGIGLDFYLGSKYPLYPALEFPEFMVKKLRKEYLVPNAIKSMGIGMFEEQLTDKRFLAMMIFEGKIRYFMKELMPDLPDTMVFEYSQKQLDWAEANEGMIWRHFAETKMLFNTEPGQYMRYLNDGPFTIAAGVPQESAPAIGVFTGYRIVKKYMEENPVVKLKDLMEDNAWEKILRESTYKPD